MCRRYWPQGDLLSSDCCQCCWCVGCPCLGCQRVRNPLTLVQVLPKRLNMTETASRAEKVTFTREIAQVSELLIARKGQSIESLDDLSEQSITLVDGTIYGESLEQSGFQGAIHWLKGVSPSDILSRIETGDDIATVMDSDIARVILPLYPDLEAKFRISKHRPIAWAVRQNTPELLLRLNEFLVAHHVQAAANTASLKDWNRIVESGRLRMLTLNNPASYFMWRGELMGFDYELMEAFAKEYKLHLAIVLKNSIPELFDALRQGEGDLIAASITATAARESEGILFTTPYLHVSEQVVGREGGPTLATLDQLPEYQVAVNPNTVFFPRVERLFEQRVADTSDVEPPIDHSEHGGDTSTATDGALSKQKSGRLLAVEATTETLVSQVLNGDFDFTVADSHLVAIESSYHKGLATPLSLTDDASIAWGVRSDQPELTRRLNQFIQKQYRGLFYNMTYNKYFKNKRSIRRYQSGRLQEGGALSPYDDLVKHQAEQYGMDWRMLVSQMYQESKFNPKAVSFAGAEGLMQVMPRTARELGYSDLFKPENGIAAGSAYMNWLEDRFPGELDVQEKLFFVLAAYNAGTGHVRDARKLARQLGLDPDRWFDHVEKAMLKLSQPVHYKKARFGYVRGSEPVAYVREIHDRYLGYLGTEAN